MPSTSERLDAIFAGLCAAPLDYLRCSRCDEWNDRPGQRWCTTCHAAYMRRWRPTHPLNAEQRRKDGARAHANTAKKRGQLVPRPCELCGTTEGVEMHHEDYDRHLDVVWLCREDHLAHHRRWVEP